MAFRSSLCLRTACLLMQRLCGVVAATNDWAEFQVSASRSYTEDQALAVARWNDPALDDVPVHAG